MELLFHGAAREVGRSCIELRTLQGYKYLLDVGVKIQSNGLQLPENVEDIKDFDGVFLSHAHLDHSGGLPLFEHKNLVGPIFCTRQTFAISKILLKDSYKISKIKNTHPAYNSTDLKKINKDVKLVSFDKWYKHYDIRFKYLNAGHIPGSAMILIECEGKRILYTADFNARKTQLMFNADVSEELRGNVDILISESTYGYRDLPDVHSHKRSFQESVRKTLENGGSALIPVFALGRAQETLLLLSEREWGVPIYYDGLCNKITRKILANKSKYVDNKDVLKDMFYNKINWVSSNAKRKRALKKKGIFVTTSGMVQGGPVFSYLDELWHDSKSKVHLMGFQPKNTNGRHLLEEGFYYSDKGKTHVKCSVEKYDFSGHADRSQLKSFTEQLQPKHVFFQHGDEEAVIEMKKWAEENLDVKSYAPIINEKYVF